MRDGPDDDFLEQLRAAISARESVPARFIETARSAFAWHNIDAELAQLTYDSSADPEPAAIRSEAASVRALTFTSDHFYIEIEVTENSLIGQLMPAGAGEIEALSQSGDAVSVPVDEIGCFVIEPVPASPFRLRCRVPGQADVVTGWITL